MQANQRPPSFTARPSMKRPRQPVPARDRKSTRLNSSHLVISYAVFCLKKKKKDTNTTGRFDLNLIGDHLCASARSARECHSHRVRSGTRLPASHPVISYVVFGVPPILS